MPGTTVQSMAADHNLLLTAVAHRSLVSRSDREAASEEHG